MLVTSIYNEICSIFLFRKKSDKQLTVLNNVLLNVLFLMSVKNRTNGLLKYVFPFCCQEKNPEIFFGSGTPKTIFLIITQIRKFEQKQFFFHLYIFRPT